MKLAEGLFCEAVMVALDCSNVRDGEGAARYDLCVLVIDKVSYGSDVSVGQPRSYSLVKVCHSSIAPARTLSRALQGERVGMFQVRLYFCLASAAIE